MTSSDIIHQARERLGTRLAILAHHYQADEIVRHADITGDSLELARKIPELSAEFIVFCGVSFMAETAAVLTSPGQKVVSPDPGADCVMAETAPAVLVRTVLERLRAGGKDVVPLAYVNSSLEVKAICGRFGGAVCTSANARTMLEWALEGGRSVLFLPDRNLGMNTARTLGLDEKRIRLLDVRQKGRFIDQDTAALPLLHLWPGVCAVHFRLRPEHVLQARRTCPTARVLVHPECNPEVVSMADKAGSTSLLIREVRSAPDGLPVYVGTESNLVNRLARERGHRGPVLPLAETFCSNMARVTEAKLANILEHVEGETGLGVPPAQKDHALSALNTMLEACSVQRSQ
ncbi:MAG: quinolinate synthase NadA [Deltaproteobacteria bacterium]|nr:quinolinate synthase NadA [Deltaproteobacteria bacterium]